MTNEKILEKIKNLLDLANNNPNEHEALAAALKAQQLMAKHGIDASAIDVDEAKDEIYHAVYSDTGKHEMKKWRQSLCTVVARNFRCEVYLSGSAVVFYGYKKDAEIALEVFKFLYNTGNKLALKCYNIAKKSGKNTRGLMNTYLMGFVAGIKEALDKQCMALMIVTPQEVKDSYAEMSKGWKSKKSTITINGHDHKTYEQGRQDGKDAISARQIAG